LASELPSTAVNTPSVLTVQISTGARVTSVRSRASDARSACSASLRRVTSRRSATIRLGSPSTWLTVTSMSRRVPSLRWMTVSHSFGSSEPASRRTRLSSIRSAYSGGEMAMNDGQARISSTE
jgi:hypothetical protein